MKFSPGFCLLPWLERDPDSEQEFVRPDVSLERIGSKSVTGGPAAKFQQ